jgi:hypothetical protein
MKSAVYAVMILASLLLVSCGKKADPMPTLQDGAKLQKDCVQLFNAYQSGEIPKNRLPHSVSDLKPLRVTREPNCIEVVIFEERGKGSWGYDVFPDMQSTPSTKGVWVQKTETKGVYIFKRWF